MPGKKKKLIDFAVLDRTFLARRHAGCLLTDPLLDDPGLRYLQQHYRDELTESGRYEIALEFQRVVRSPVLRALFSMSPRQERKQGSTETPEEELDRIINAPPMRIIREQPS